MSAERWNLGASAERRQLAFLAAAAAVIAAGSFALAGHRVAPAILALVAVAAAAGACAHRWIGRDVYLCFAVVATLIGSVVSVVAVGLTYLVAIGGAGSLLRAWGVNRLQRRFEECRTSETMLSEAPRTDAESFRRQS